MSYFLSNDIKLMFERFNEISQQILEIHKDYLELIKRQVSDDRKSNSYDRKSNSYDRKLNDRKLNDRKLNDRKLSLNNQNEEKQNNNIINNRIIRRHPINRDRKTRLDNDYSRSFYYYTRHQLSDNRLNQLMNNVFSMIINDEDQEEEESPVNVRLTETEIDNATYSCHFKDIKDKKYDTCPISKEKFTDNDNVCQIKSCKHVFLKENLMKWFNVNTRCPVCRYDIKNNDTDT